MSGLWIPLESNPEFLQNLGVPSNWTISDVCSLDDELLSFIPCPSLAFLLLYPISSASDEYRKQKQEELNASGYKPSEKVYFMKQFIKNACGTVALIHAVANNREVLKMDEDAVLEKFIESTIGLSPEEKAYKLEANDSISSAHEISAQEGQTEAPNPNDSVDLHFVAIVNVDGEIYELDGRMDQPMSHGPTTAETFIKDAAKVCKDFMQRDPETLNFTVLSFGPAQ